jgi:predicted RNA-binding protein
MCEMDVYLVDKTGHETLYFESVDKLTPVGENLVLEDIFSQRKTVKARIRDMAFIKHRIVLEAVE